MRGTGYIMLGLLLPGLLACSEQQQQQAADTNVVAQVSSEPELQQDPVRYTRGLKLYQNTCADCHGKQGEGAPNWQQRPTGNSAMRMENSVRRH